MIVGIGLSLFFLYKDTYRIEREELPPVLDDKTAVLRAVPTNALLVCTFSSLKDASEHILKQDAFFLFMHQQFLESNCPKLKNAPVSVSLHNTSVLLPLYVIDARGLSDDVVEEFESIQEGISALNLKAKSKGKLFFVSQVESLIDSAIRHLENSMSVLDADGFARAYNSISGKSSSDNFLFVSGNASEVLLKYLASSDFYKYSRFFTSFAKWFAFSFDCESNFYLDGTAVSTSSSEFNYLLSDLKFTTSNIDQMLPENTVFALSIPFKSTITYRNAFESWLDAYHKLSKCQQVRKEIKNKYGISPDEWEAQMDIQEVSTICFSDKGALYQVNLVRVGNNAKAPISYPGILSSLYGDVFAIGDESKYVSKNSWIISGSEDALEAYLAKAITKQDFSIKPKSLIVLFDFKPLEPVYNDYFSLKIKDKLLPCINQSSSFPVQLALKNNRKKLNISVSVSPTYSPSVEISSTNNQSIDSKQIESDKKNSESGNVRKYQVKNCQTNKINNLYVKDSKLCLDDENCKNLWSVAFNGNICGSVATIDFFRNGKLQFLFASGTKLYLVDRLGRNVEGFPLDLKKEIVLGPSVYDFSSSRKYNILLLHSDNTIQMYNLQGVKPSSWKGISPSEKISSLPQRKDIGSKTYWIVSTNNNRKLVYPFSGGSPLSKELAKDVISE